MTETKIVVSVSDMAKLVHLSRARFYQLIGSAFPHPLYDVLRYAPRDPNSPHRNRLMDTFTRMIEEGLLVKVGTKYMPGPNYAAFRAKYGATAAESVALATAI